MTYEEFEEQQHKVDTINKLLDKLNSMLDKVNEDEKGQLLIYMEYLEIEYRKLVYRNRRI